MNLGLKAPSNYFEAPIIVVNIICNGCGTAGWKGKLVPDTVYLLCLSAACQIHDWEYAHGETEADKVLADINFLHNMQMIVDAKGGLLRYPRTARIYNYYLAVKTFGDDAYWEGKERQ